jgi:hypothetical protein
LPIVSPVVARVIVAQEIASRLALVHIPSHMKHWSIL